MNMALRNMLLGVSVVVNFLLLWTLFLGDNGFMGYRNLQNDSAELSRKIESLKAENRALSTEIRLLKSDEGYLEHTIRKTFNFVKENEIWYIFPEEQDLQSGEGQNETKD